MTAVREMTASDASAAFCEAVKGGETDTVREMCESRGREEVEGMANRRIEGATPLIIACLRGHTDIVRYLVNSCGADVELKGSAKLLLPPAVRIIQGSPLYYAAAEGHIEIVKFLVQKSAEVDSRIETLSTPLRTACIHGHSEVVKFLVENGSDVNQANVDQHTPLHTAMGWNRPAVIKYLIEHGAKVTVDINGVAGSLHCEFDANSLTLESVYMYGCAAGQTPLHLGSLKGYVEAIEALILHSDINVNQKDAEGNTALLFAADSNHLSTVQLLLQNGAKQIPNKNGLTPLLTTAALGKLELVKVLIQSGGRDHINLAGSDPKQYINVTPLLAAASHPHEEVVLYMLSESRCFLSHDDHVKALELLGAAFQCHKYSNRRKAAEYWIEALRLREKHSTILGKPNPASIIYRCRGEREFETLAQLNSINHSDVKMSIQAGLIFDRIAGSVCQPKIFHIGTIGALWEAGTKTENFGVNFVGTIRIFQHAITLMLENIDVFHRLHPEMFYHYTRKIESALKKDRNRTSKQVKFEQILRAQTDLQGVLRKQKEILDNKDKMDCYKTEYLEEITQHHIYMVVSLIQLISLTCGMLTDATPSEEKAFRKLVTEAMEMRLKGAYGHTLTEMASDEATSLLQYNDGDRFPIVKFPCVLTISLLESLMETVK